jgi:hypothetical protein
MKPLFVSCLLLPALAITSLAATPQFSPRQTITTGFQHFYGMAVADFNGDGKADIAVTDNAVKKLFIYLNDGKGSFGTPISMDLTMAALGPGRIVAGDFNEDGKQDLIIGTVAGLQSNLVLIGNGDGTFTQMPDIPNSFGFLSAVAVDVNGDHHLDLVLGVNPGVSVFLGDGRGGFRSGSISGTTPLSPATGVAVGDFNKDGKLDFAAALPTGVNIYVGNGDGTFTLSNTISSVVTINVPAYLGIADFDGDGNPDLVIGSTSVATVVSGKGDGTFDTSKAYQLPTIPRPVNQNPNPYPNYVLVADIDGDQKPDVVNTDDSEETVNVSLNNTVNVLRTRPGGPYTEADVDFYALMDQGVFLVSAADLNGDGLPDIVLGSNVTQNISVYLSIKPKTYPEVTVSPSIPSVFVGSPYSVTVKVAGSSGIVPTGPVTLMDDSISLGQQALDASGQAIFTLSNLAAGYHTFSAVYPGDTNYFARPSIVLVGGSVWDMQIASTTPSQTVTAGSTANYTLSVTPAGGLNGIITFTCSQLPSLATCDPVTVTPWGQPASATLTVRTTAPLRSQNSTPHYALALLPLFAVCCVRRRRLPTPLLCITLICTLGFFATGCSSSKSATTTPGTPSGSTQFTVTASITSGGQTLTRTTTATLVVQ